MTAPTSIGPVTGALVTVPDLTLAVTAYRDWLELEPIRSGAFDALRARRLGLPTLADAPSCELGRGPHADGWLTLIEDAEGEPVAPFRTPGWMALEICVIGVDSLAERLADGPFDIVGAPANLAVGDSIRAMQAVGPGGEVLYLTEIFAPMPPFELPQAIEAVDHLFIPVLAARSLDATLQHLAEVPTADPLRFTTRLSALNAAHGLPAAQEHPVATIQLAGNCLFEIDQLPGNPATRPARAHGIAAISCRAAAATVAALGGDDRSAVVTGPDGEVLELVAER